ncbi:histidine kinase dimerization/phosphoacceptor domain -containing protein [Candidatus Magnetominusculus xianensis]|uniref:Sensor histidine kinase n=1 Tax=Candidatus Magnetominusculus xianensis TaxID=1748249 RepID=A0ABR5SF42_9BACT|nr:histidine kinase dimerization/phosphoacceptor domain -containing protein [Candidatus Magnetominusculus xianensis]KWT85554.1 putative sensor histidine kinase [Candidatus Magnetominusculus xianensis]MBF0404215.1 PAS domain S-box protein [Nitrospirota bacterium]
MSAKGNYSHSLLPLLEFFVDLHNPPAVLIKDVLLVVSADKEIVRLITDTMSETGCETHHAGNTADGLTLYHKIKPPVVIADTQSVGLSFIEELNISALDNTSIAALADRAPINEMEKYFDAGVSTFLWKPLNRTELKGALSYSLRQSRLLKERENVFRVMANSITDAFVIVDEKFNILFWNKEAEKIFLFKAADVIGQSLLTTIISEQYHHTLSKYIGHITKNIDYLSNRNIYAMAHDKNQREIFCKIKMMPLEIRSSVLAVIAFKDATDLQARQELIMLKGLIDNLQIGFVIGDPEGTIIYANSFVNKILCLGKAPISGRNARDLFPILSDLYTPENLVRLEKYSTDYTIKFNADDILYIRLKCDTVLNSSGSISAVFITCEDMSECVELKNEDNSPEDAALKHTKELTEKYEKLQMELSRRNIIEDRMGTTVKDLNMLLKEVHHRVKNNLQIISSLISLQSEAITDEYLLTIFKDTQTRIRAMALIHDKLYKSTNMSMLNFSEYIQDLMAELYATYEHYISGVALKVDIDPDLDIDIDIAIPCGLIINELITNSIKYAFPDRHDGIIKVSFDRHENGKYTFSVGDNGVGCPAGINFKTTKSLGLQLVNDLITRKLKGTIDIDAENGTKYYMEFYRPK